jgi:hypothetical protein
MRSGVNVFLSGASGTGKSFLIKQFMEENKNKNIIKCAPKGMAAAGAGDDTLHSVFAIPKGILKVGDYNSQPEKAVMDADIVIIDDISMCRIDVFEYVVRTLLNIRKNLKLEGDMDHYEKQIILSGDFYRMPPVINREDKQDFRANWGFKRGEDRFAFNSSLWDKSSMANVILGEQDNKDIDAGYLENADDDEADVEPSRAFVVVSTFYKDLSGRSMSGTHHIRKISAKDYTGWAADEDALLQDEWSGGIGIDEI